MALAATSPTSGDGAAGAYALLAPLLADSDNAVRVAAAWAIGKLGFPHALAALVPLLSDPAAEVADAAAGALAFLRWDSFLEPGEVATMAGPVLHTAGGRPADAPASAMLVHAEAGAAPGRASPRRRLLLVDARELRVCEVELDSTATTPVPGGALQLVRHGQRVPVRPLLRAQPEWISAILADTA
jgi:hypothetical protein